MELFCYLCAALDSLPETQGRRVDACVILGKSYSEVARAEGVHESAVRRSVERGLEKDETVFEKVPVNPSELICQMSLVYERSYIRSTTE